MSQKYIKMQNKNRDSAAFGKYFATAVYDKKFVDTDELASYLFRIGIMINRIGEAKKGMCLSSPSSWFILSVD